MADLGSACPAAAQSSPGRSSTAPGCGTVGRAAIGRAACFSPCGTYRYGLWRRWGPGPSVLMVGLNPSTADASHDDATIRRCIGFARAWNYGALCMANLFAYRAVHPSSLLQAEDPIGPQNDRSLQRLAQAADLVVAAWGNHGTFHNRERDVRGLLPQLHVLRLNRNGQPSHPLYLPAHLTPQPWSGQPWLAQQHAPGQRRSQDAPGQGRSNAGLTTSLAGRSSSPRPLSMSMPMSMSMSNSMSRFQP